MSESPFWDAFVSKVDDRAKKPRKRTPKKLPGSRHSSSEEDADAVFVPEPPKKKTGSSGAAKRSSLPASDFYSGVPPPSKRSPRLAEKLGETAYGGESGSVDYDDQLLFWKVEEAEEIVETAKPESGVWAVLESPIFDGEPPVWSTAIHGKLGVSFFLLCSA